MAEGSRNLSCWNPNGGHTGRHIRKDDGVGSNSGMGADAHRPQDSGSGADIDVAADLRNATSIACSDSNLLKNQTFHADAGFGMNDDAVRMRDEQAAAYAAGQRDIGAGDHAPKAMAQNKIFAQEDRHGTSFGAPMLIAPDGLEQLATGIPEPPRLLTSPIRDFGADAGCRLIQLAYPHELQKPQARGWCRRALAHSAVRAKGYGDLLPAVNC